MTIIHDKARENNALALIAADAVHSLGNNRYVVESQTEASVSYDVDTAAGTCTCPDQVYRHSSCKHLRACALWEELRAEITDFLARREDMTLAALLYKLHQHTVDAAHEAKNKAYINIVYAMLNETTPTPPPASDPTETSLAFVLRFWWPGMDAHKALDSTIAPVVDEDVSGLQVKFPTDHDFRPSSGSIATIRDFIDEHDLTVKKFESITHRQGPGRREWLWNVSVYKGMAQ